MMSMCCITIIQLVQQSLTKSVLMQLLTMSPNMEILLTRKIQINLPTIFTNSPIDHESSTFLQQCLKQGEDAYQSFYQTRFVDKTEKLFDTILKMRTSKRSTSTIQTYNLKKETVSFIRYIDYVRSQTYGLRNLSQFELTSTSFFLTK